MHYDVWWLYHFRRENSFRTFYRRFSGLIFGTRNNSVRWLLIFGCAQDDTQRVEQEGVYACTRVPRRAIARSRDRKFFRMSSFFETLGAPVQRLPTPYCGEEWKIPFFGRHQKKKINKAAPKMQATRERTRGEWRAYSRARAQNHTTR